jgi:hypothetical protein
MTRQQAEREAKKRWGARAMIRAGEALSSPEKRAEAFAKIKASRERKEAIDREVKERLAAMGWYQALMAERQECLRVVSQTQGWASYRKFAVGRDIGTAFSIEGQGDTWEEAFAAATKSTVPA